MTGTPGSRAAARSREASLTPDTATTWWPERASAAPSTAPTRPAPTTPTASRAGRSSLVVTDPTYPPGSCASERGRDRSQAHDLSRPSATRSSATTPGSSRSSRAVQRTTTRPRPEIRRCRAMSSSQCSTCMWNPPSTSRTSSVPSGRSHSQSRNRTRPALSRRRTCRRGSGRPARRHMRRTSISASEWAPPATSSRAARNSRARGSGRKASRCSSRRGADVRRTAAAGAPEPVRAPRRQAAAGAI